MECKENPNGGRRKAAGVGIGVGMQGEELGVGHDCCLEAKIRWDGNDATGRGRTRGGSVNVGVLQAQEPRENALCLCPSSLVQGN